MNLRKLSLQNGRTILSPVLSDEHASDFSACHGHLSKSEMYDLCGPV